MKTHEELVEEIYNHPGFKNEFMSYARLKSTLEAEWQSKPKAPAALNPAGVRFISYYDIGAKPTVEPDSVLVSKCKRGICFLYSSLFRALSTSYNLASEETRRLIFAVADRYS
ncbi:hypothetical protein [Fibrella forsythiae]|uniref:Uncharacterized protein n=1 Tax=Fibrella forsythiae TaxID=2817061 RepID=A0ABS3JUT5_9BACT|nr:hypothetical protein [Fibrella forsythiae]MBO0952667.1 hypothetical protein [Fibrella forsythiae]